MKVSDWVVVAVMAIPLAIGLKTWHDWVAENDARAVDLAARERRCADLGPDWIPYGRGLCVQGSQRASAGAGNRR